MAGITLKELFLSSENNWDLSRVFGIRYNQLVFHLYVTKPEHRYHYFEIPKKTGGVRGIYAPSTNLNLIQKKLNSILSQIYEPKASVHGFTYKKNIVTNAFMHRRKKLVLNLDLKDFFPSITFARVRGIFMAKPYLFNEDVATTLAQICCYKNSTTDLLPQGASTSPIITNIICSKMDKELLRLAEKKSCIYTRYADDITFSTNLEKFPKSVVNTKAENLVGKGISTIIKDNGFKINKAKIRLQTPLFRQEVTGLTVNEFPNVRRKFVRDIRGMLNAWRKYGKELAQEMYTKKYQKAYKGSFFHKVLRGKIEFLGMVRGKEDFIYLKYLNQYNSLAGLKAKEIINPKIDLKNIGKEIHSLQKKYEILEKESLTDIIPYHFNINPIYENVRIQLDIDNKEMQREKSRGDFQGFCGYAIKQLETGIKRVIESPFYEYMKTFVEADADLKKVIYIKQISRSHLENLIRLTVAFWLPELHSSGWLEKTDKYWYHDMEHPLSNNYCVLNYVRKIRNLDHREGDGNHVYTDRLETDINRTEKILDELKLLPPNPKKINATVYELQTLKNTIIFYREHNYALIEETLYKFIEIILSDPKPKLDNLIAGFPPAASVLDTALE